MLFSNFSYDAFLQWMLPLSIDFSVHDIPSQDLAAVLAGLGGSSLSPLFGLIVALVFAGALLLWIFRSSEFRQDRVLLGAGLVIGLIIVAAWYLTAGSGGQALLEELDFMDERPFFTGAQSLTFVGPAAHVLQYLKEGFASIFLTFGVATFTGVAVGSFLYTLIFRKIRIEWFVEFQRFRAPCRRRGIDGHRRRARAWLHHRPGHHRAVDAGARIGADDPGHHRRQRGDDEIPVLPDDARIATDPETIE